MVQLKTDRIGHPESLDTDQVSFIMEMSAAFNDLPVVPVNIPDEYELLKSYQTALQESPGLTETSFLEMQLKKIHASYPYEFSNYLVLLETLSEIVLESGKIYGSVLPVSLLNLMDNIRLNKK